MDPIDLVKGITRGNFGAQIVIGLLPTLGLDGLLAVGASAISDEEGYESITHLHILMANPRAGILQMIAVRPGDCTPEAWVPDDAASYITGNLKVDQFYEHLQKIVDTIQGEGTLDGQVQKNINDKLDLDLRTDILDGLTGRITLINWMEKPFRINSQCSAAAVELKDPAAFEPVLEKVIDKLLELRKTRRGNDDTNKPEPEFKGDYRGVTTWNFKDLVGPNRRGGRIRVDINGNQLGNDDSDNDEIKLREQYPNVAIVGNDLVVCDSRAFLERAIDTFKGDNTPLSEDEQYKRVSRQMQRMLGTTVPAGALYTRPDRTLELWYEMARSEDAKKLLDRNSEDNDFVSSIKSRPGGQSAAGLFGNQAVLCTGWRLCHIRRDRHSHPFVPTQERRQPLTAGRKKTDLNNRSERHSREACLQRRREAGIQRKSTLTILDPRLRGDDESFSKGCKRVHLLLIIVGQGLTDLL